MADDSDAEIEELQRRFNAVIDAQRREVLALCERIGYGFVIDIAARGWAAKRGAWGLHPVEAGPEQMASWLRTYADHLVPPDPTPTSLDEE